jgi:CheY-like chemotaxis protein
MNILVVDNDENTVETFKAALSGTPDYKIDVAYGGKEALGKIRADTSCNLVILDIMMPEVSGIDVCKIMCQDEKLKNIPVLLVSALPIASSAFQESLGKLGELSVIKDVLEKPAEISNLLAKVKKILGK